MNVSPVETCLNAKIPSMDIFDDNYGSLMLFVTQSNELTADFK